MGLLFDDWTWKKVSILVRGTINTVRVSVFDAILNLSFSELYTLYGDRSFGGLQSTEYPDYATVSNRLNSANLVLTFQNDSFSSWCVQNTEKYSLLRDWRLEPRSTDQQGNCTRAAEDPVDAYPAWRTALGRCTSLAA